MLLTKSNYANQTTFIFVMDLKKRTSPSSMSWSRLVCSPNLLNMKTGMLRYLRQILAMNFFDTFCQTCCTLVGGMTSGPDFCSLWSLSDSVTWTAVTALHSENANFNFYFTVSWRVLIHATWHVWNLKRTFVQRRKENQFQQQKMELKAS